MTDEGPWPPAESDQLPAIIPPTTVVTLADTSLASAGASRPAGDAAGWRYVECFTAYIRNPHTRRDLMGENFQLVRATGLTLPAMRSFDVA